MSEALDRRVATRRQAELVAGLRKLKRGPSNGAAATNRNGNGAGGAVPEERCDLCGKGLPAEHRHLLHLTERRILCTCESCLALRGGDAELRPTGTRTIVLEDFDLPEEIWAAFSIPIGLAFFIDSSGTGEVGALYPSPAGATECELDLDAWDRLCEVNPLLADLEPDGEALIVNRMAEPHQYAIAPIDECYRLVGMIKVAWDGISGGSEVDAAITGFFDELAKKSE